MDDAAEILEEWLLQEFSRVLCLRKVRPMHSHFGSHASEGHLGVGSRTTCAGDECHFTRLLLQQPLGKAEAKSS